MLRPVAKYFMGVVGVSVLAASPCPVWGQVPDPASAPRLVVPSRSAAAPVAQTPGQPTTSPAAEPAPVTAVSAPPAGVTSVGTAPTTSSSAQAATASAARSYVAGKFGFTLEGGPIGWPKSVDGGSATADVVVERGGPDRIAAKHLAGIKYEPIVLVTNLDSKTLNDWIAASWNGTAPRKSGSIQSMDYDFKVMSELEFNNALLTETTLPALDAASKDAAYITVKLLPEFTRPRAGSGAKASGAFDSKSQKKWSPANFRFEMTGLDGSKVSKIDSFTVRQVVAESPVGEQRDYQKEPGAIEFPNLKITLAAQSAQTWTDWHDDFVVKGNNGADRERSGAILYLDSSLKSELARVNLSGCGIFRLAPEKVVAGSETVRRVVAELYCERMEFVAKDAGK